MRTHHLRASWIAAILAAVLALGAPVAGSVAEPGDGSPTGSSPGGSPSRAGTSVHPFTDRAPAVRARPAREPRREHVEDARSRAAPHLLVRIPADIAARRWPDVDAAAVGVVPAGSKYYDVPTTVWIEETAKDGRWGRVEIPYAWPRRDGWIPLRGLPRDHTFVEVHVDLSRHWVAVTKRGTLLFGLRAATGAPASPTPPGHYFVTDRIPFTAGGSLGSFAFGISGIQPRLPAGWSGGNQLAIHGTSSPSTLGQSVSAGCVRVSEVALDRLMPLLRLGTPVVVDR